MSDILKSWIANLPKSEMQEMESSIPNGSESADSGVEQSNVPFADGPPQELKETLPLEIGNDIQRLFSPKYIQIDSPQRLHESILRLFCMGTKKVLLLNPKNGETAPCALRLVQTAYLEADSERSTVIQQCGESLLVAFLFLPDRQYILQTTVDEINGNRMKLRYQDPRYGTRWKLPSSQEVTLYKATPEMTAIIAKNKVQAVREMDLSYDRTANCRKLQIADITCLPDSSKPLTAAQYFDGEPSYSCSLEDISLGGAGLSSNDLRNKDDFPYQLIRLDATLPPLMHDNTSLQLRLQSFAVVHGVSTMNRLSRLHVQFLKRLPQELMAFFEQLSAAS
jgi:hypothetical protein